MTDEQVRMQIRYGAEIITMIWTRTLRQVDIQVWAQVWRIRNDTTAHLVCEQAAEDYDDR